MKRQQAVEDAIALRLATNETGHAFETLPPGKIFGMTITEPCVSTSNRSPDQRSSKTSNLDLRHD